MKPKKAIAYGTLLVSFLLLALVLWKADWSIIQTKIRQIEVHDMAAVFVVYFIFCISKTFRLGAMLPKGVRPGFPALFRVMAKHGFYLSVLPGRLGDLVYASLLKDSTGVAQGLGFASLYVVRVYDLLALSVMTTIAIWGADLSTSQAARAALAVMFAGSILLAVFLQPTMRAAALLVHKLHSSMSGVFLLRIANAIEESARELDEKTGLWSHVQLLGATAVSWLCIVLVYQVLLSAFDLDIPLTGTVLLVAMVNLVGLLPIQTIGGFGVKEGGLVMGFSVLGMSLESASSHAILVRFIVYLLPILFAGLILFHFWIAGSAGGRSANSRE
ncbi:MAG: flippase-like domain-containing protein [Pseudomonadota bacterium]|nr:MAG: flippase-like domain-containing protein [Pseudomonadota bacterium]